MIKLDTSNGKTIPQAYQEYYIASLMASRRWRGALVKQWTTHGGSGLRWINGKQYFGGVFNFKDLLSHPDMVKMADLLGIDDQGKYDITHIDGADWVRAYFRPTPKSSNPYSVENVGYMLENGVAPKAAADGLSTIVFKSINIEVPVVYYNGIADDPQNHKPTLFEIKSAVKTSLNFNSNLSLQNTLYTYSDNILLQQPTALKNSQLDKVFLSIYSLSTFFEQFCTNAMSIELVDTIQNQITHKDQTWVFQIWHTFNMGDYSWMNVDNVKNYLYDAIKIGESKEEDYFTKVTTRNFKGRQDRSLIIKNLSGYIMDVVDGSISGNWILALFHRSPYEWAIIDDGRLWFELDYINAMDIKEFAYMLSLHLDIEAGADSGFWGTFIGGFIGAIVGLVSTVIGAFFKLVELCDIFFKPMIHMMLSILASAGIISKKSINDIMEAYTIIRNQIALFLVTLGIGSYIEGAEIAAESSAALVEAGLPALTAEESGMILSEGVYDLMAASLMNMSIIDIASEGLKMVGSVYSGLNSADANALPSSSNQTVTTDTQLHNPIEIVYGGSIDFIDAFYIIMYDLGMYDPRNDPMRIVYA